MKENINETSKPANEPIVIADECGDTLWDAVLNQEITICAVNEVSKNAALLLNSVKAVQERPDSAHKPNSGVGDNVTEAKLIV